MYSLKKLTFCLALFFNAAHVGAEPMPVKADEPWQANKNSLSKHHVPEWLLDAKIGVQFVGERLDMDDTTAYHWMNAAQRVRKLGYKESDDALRKHVDDFSVVGRNRGHKVPYVFTQEAPAKIDLNKMMRAYQATGAKFLVSQVQGAYPGAEGLLMLEEEIAAARQFGFHIGLHNNLLNRETQPSAGDPGYVNYYQNRLRSAIETHQAEFVFFDGAMTSPNYFQTFQTVAWYYNWAEKNGIKVWVNDDFGKPLNEKIGHSDVIDHEGFTMSGVADHAWVNWDTLRNEWTCWVNEFGNHRRSGERWTWQYRKAENVLQIFLYNVSIGGVWIAQIDNTKQAWSIMDEIGDWLSINGEAIYNTRPVAKVDPKAYRLPDKKHTPIDPSLGDMPMDGVGHWFWRWQQTLAWAKKQGPIYTTVSKNGGIAYAIHMGKPVGDITVKGIVPAKNSTIRLLGSDQTLTWDMNAGKLVIHVPSKLSKSLEKQYAYSFKISIE